MAVMTSMLITAVVVLGLQINTGLAGQVNIGQAAFMGVGAYSTAVLASKLHVPFWLALPAGGVFAAFFGLIFGLAAVRIKGFYLALTTIAAQILFHFFVLNLPQKWLGGSNGITLEPAELFGFKFESDVGMYYLCLVVAMVMIAGAYGIARSRHGRIFAAVRDDDVASGMMGINVVRTKALAFLVGAFYAGIGGGLWAYYIRFVAIDQFTLIHSIWFIAMIIVGGMGSITGALIGVFVIRMAQESITSMGPALIERIPFLGGDLVFAVMNIFLGGIIAGFLIFEPRGLMHRWNIAKRSYRMWPYPY
jgi:branched-chain amino acid transport system permease protein